MRPASLPAVAATAHARAAPEQVGRVGPNAVVQLGAALLARVDWTVARRIYIAAGREGMLASPPSAMVDQRAVADLHAALFAQLPLPLAVAIAADAGVRTADYLLGNRIPAPAQRLLRALPSSLAARLLLRAIARNAWTFAGSGEVRTRAGRICCIEITDNPIAIPGCPWHAAVFGHLFRELVAAAASVEHDACCATGAPTCRFTIRL